MVNLKINGNLEIGEGDVIINQRHPIIPNGYINDLNTKYLSKDDGIYDYTAGTANIPSNFPMYGTCIILSGEGIDTPNGEYGCQILIGNYEYKGPMIAYRIKSPSVTGYDNNWYTISTQRLN